MVRITAKPSRPKAWLDPTRFSSVHFDSQKLKADGKSFCEVTLKLAPSQPSDETITLHLTAGSFEGSSLVRTKTFQAENGEVRFRVYAPKRPRSGFLLADGLRAPLYFSPANYFQYLAYDLIPTIVFSIILALLVRSFALASYYIPSGSMEPTLDIRDRLLADRFSYTFKLREPRRGDIMIFKFPGDPRQDFIKRVIGLPGERVKIENGTVYINGEPLNEPYIMEPPRYSMEEIEVGKDEYFVLGDNRNRSADSHIWGLVPRKNLVGRAILIYWPINRVRILSNPFNGTEPLSAPQGEPAPAKP